LNTSPRPPLEQPPNLAAAAAALEALNRLTADIRRELAQVRRDIAREAAHYSDARCAELLEANEHLAEAAMHAARRADEAEAKFERSAAADQFDALTGLPTRNVMRDRLGEALALARRHGTCLALFFVDLDGFKEVNDTAGHAAGDEVLKQLAVRLRSAVRECDTVSRRGGDEFLVLLPEVAGREAATCVAQKMLHVVAQPVPAGGAAPICLSASIGIALRPCDGDDAGVLIGCADRAMYEAKRAGRNTYRFADDSSPDPAAAPPPPVPSPRDALLRNLRDANEQLLLTALRAQQLLDAAELAREHHARAVAVLVHELRNPLAPIATLGHWLGAAHADDAKLAKAGEVISRRTAQMAHLIDDMLDSARAGARGFGLHPSKVALCEILERSIEAAKAAMLSRQQLLSAQLPPATLELEADPMRLEQVFSNLLDNASKYTPARGHIRLSAEEGDGWITVTVSDDGIGISARALPHIFDLFVQEESARDHDPHGLGIGLAVVRELVRAHGGTVEARSEGQDCGSTFVVRLPCSLPATGSGTAA